MTSIYKTKPDLILAKPSGSPEGAPKASRTYGEAGHTNQYQWPEGEQDSGGQKDRVASRSREGRLVIGEVNVLLLIGAPKPTPKGNVEPAVFLTKVTITFLCAYCAC